MNLIVLPLSVPLSLPLSLPRAMARTIPIGRSRPSFAARAAVACSLAVCARANAAPSAVGDVRGRRVERALCDREVSS